MQFEIKALRGKGEVVLLAIEAPDAPTAISQAVAQGHAVIGVAASRALPQLRRRHAAFPLLLFTQQLLALLQSGLSLVESLDTLAAKEGSAPVKSILDAIVARLYEGQPLSIAMQEFPSVFPALYVATVRASEKTGDIPEALGRYVAYQSQLDVVRKKIVNASIYPALLLAVGALVVLFLMAYVVPRFAAVYEGAGGDLPLLSRWLIEWGTLLSEHGGMVAGVAALLFAAAGWAATRPALHRRIVERLWQVPALGERMRMFQLARLYRTLGMLMKGGIPAPTAMEMASPLLQPALRAQLGSALQAVREGQGMSDAFERHHLTTPVSQRMLRVGERAGNMGDMMERAASFYDEEMARWVDWFTRLFEPLLMAFIGVIIGAIVVLMYLPVFELAGSLQ